MTREVPRGRDDRTSRCAIRPVRRSIARAPAPAPASGAAPGRGPRFSAACAASSAAHSSAPPPIVPWKPPGRSDDHARARFARARSLDARQRHQRRGSFGFDRIDETAEGQHGAASRRSVEGADRVEDRLRRARRFEPRLALRIRRVHGVEDRRIDRDGEHQRRFADRLRAIDARRRIGSRMKPRVEDRRRRRKRPESCRSRARGWSDAPCAS